MFRDPTILMLCGVVALASCAPPCPDARCSSRPLQSASPQPPEADAAVPIVSDATPAPPMEFSDWVPAERGDDDQWVSVGTFGPDGLEVKVDFRNSTADDQQIKQEWRVTNTGDRPAGYTCEVQYTCATGEEPTDQGGSVLAPGSAGNVSAAVRCGALGRAQTIQVRCKVNEPPG